MDTDGPRHPPCPLPWAWDENSPTPRWPGPPVGITRSFLEEACVLLSLGGGWGGSSGRLGWRGGGQRPREPERSPCPGRQVQEIDPGSKASDCCFQNPVFGEQKGKTPSCKEAVPVPTSQTRKPWVGGDTEPKDRGFPSSHTSSPRHGPCLGLRALEASVAKHGTPWAPPPPQGSSWPVRLAPLRVQPQDLSTGQAIVPRPPGAGPWRLGLVSRPQPAPA